MRKRLSIIVSLCIFAGATTLCGCGKNENDADIYSYQTTDAVYHVAFEDGGISGKLEKRGSSCTLSISSPESIAGVAVTYDGSVCRLCADSVEIPLSADAASGIMPLFSLLGTRGGGTPAKSSDGQSTVIAFDDGTVTVQKSGSGFSVAEIEMETELGRRRVIFEPYGE